MNIHQSLRNTVLIALGVVLAHGACAQAPEPTPAPASMAAPATLGSAYLSHLVAQAAAHHPSVKGRMAEVTASLASVDAARWQYYPTPSVLTERGANQTTHKTGANSVAGSTGSTTFRLQQPVWSGGRLDAGVRVSELKTSSALRAVEEAQLNVALRVAEAWQGLLVTYGRVQSSQQNLDKLEKLGEAMTRRVTQQVSPSVEAELSRSRLLQAKAELASAKIAYDGAKLKLIQWTGDLSAVRVEDRPLDDALLQQVLDERAMPYKTSTGAALQQALERHPTMRRLEADLEVAQQDVQLKQSEQWPTVYARLDRQFTDNPNSGARIADTVAYMGLQLSLGAGLSLRSQVEAALAKVQGLQSDKETALREVRERIESEWREYQSAVQRAEQAELVLQSTVELLASYERLFVVGRRSWLELLNTVKEVGFAQQSRNDLRAQIQASRFRLQLYGGELAWQQNAEITRLNQ